MLDLQILNAERLIHLTEISAANTPATNSYKYKCRVQITSVEGETLVQRDLFARMQPSWLVELKNKGDCIISITFCCREGDISHPWQDVGTVTFATQDYLNAGHNADLEFPITTWEKAPQLTLKARLTESTGEGSSSTVTVFNQKAMNRAHRRNNGNGKAEVELPSDIPLTPPEEVIVKDVWNKLRAWKELQMEKFLKRLLLEEPELEYLFGEAIDSMSDFFYELFDCAIHTLQPETQVVVGEPLMGVPPEKGDGFDTIEDYGKFFAGIGLQTHHWIKA